MKYTNILGYIVFALPALAAPAPAATGSRTSGSCPSNNRALLTSNNNVDYKVRCHKDLSTEVIRITDTEIGIQGCLTACDGTIGCTAVTFVASDESQNYGVCYNRKKGKPHRAGDDTAVAFRVSPEPTLTITTWPTNPATTTTSASSTSVSTTSTTSASTTGASPPPTDVGPTIFGGVSIRSGSDIQYGSINANGTNFYIGRDTSTYCPSEVVDPCPVQNYTVFATNNNTLGLNVVVPGGQQVYVNATGALKFTVAHSGYTGVNSTTTGFRINGSNHLQFDGNDFLACPVDATSWQVYAASATAASGFNTTDCLGFGFLVVTSTATPVAAWQYV